MASRIMSDAEVKRRKKVQGRLSQTTSTLGLAGVGVGTAAAVASKKPGTLKHIRKIPGAKNATQPGLKDAGLYTSLASGGISGVGGYNFAAYTNAESRRRKPVMETTKKNLDPEMDAVHGEIGKAENWSPIKGNPFDAEEKRHKRGRAGELAGGATTGVLTGLGAVKAGEGLSQHAKSLPGGKKKVQGPRTSKQHAHKLKGIKAGKASAKLLAGAAAAAGATAGWKKYRQSDRYASYAKSATSAFGVVHD